MGDRAGADIAHAQRRVGDAVPGANAIHAGMAATYGPEPPLTVRTAVPSPGGDPDSWDGARRRGRLCPVRVLRLVFAGTATEKRTEMARFVEGVLGLERVRIAGVDAELFSLRDGSHFAVASPSEMGDTSRRSGSSSPTSTRRSTSSAPPVWRWTSRPRTRATATRTFAPRTVSSTSSSPNVTLARDALYVRMTVTTRAAARRSARTRESRPAASSARSCSTRARGRRRRGARAPSRDSRAPDARRASRQPRGGA